MRKRASARLCQDTLSRHIRGGALPSEYSAFVEEVCEGALRGLDVDQFRDLDEWARWLSWATVVLDEADYLTAATHALRLAPGIKGTDYGTSRQRDLGQLWTDATRGFLGEIAFVKWLRERFGVIASLDFRRGRIEEFLPSDIAQVNGRPPRLRVSIKTTKFRGVWLDIPYSQIEHSDVFVLVRVGVTREHFVAFLKSLSVIRDKILKAALERGVISQAELSEIWDALPSFSKIPAYVAGFVDKREHLDRLARERVLIADGEVRGRKNVRLEINKFLGYWEESEPFRRAVLEKFEGKLGAGAVGKLSVSFEGIGKFSSAKHFLASSGVLKKREDEWRRLVAEL